MTYTIDELKHKVFGRVFDVYEIFQNFFGEDYVDLQELPPDILFLPAGCSLDQLPSYDISDAQIEDIAHSIRSFQPVIMVWWPEVTVSNEHDRSVKIQDLYAKIEITTDGRIPYENTGFMLDRSTFTDIQLASGYIHSHVPGMYRELRGFQSPCLGRGPIRSTIGDLKNDYEEALWMLFCRELSLYVTVESLTGGPYMRLEEIGNNRLDTHYNEGFKSINYSKIEAFYNNRNISSLIPVKTFIMEFTEFYLSRNSFVVSFSDGVFKCGMSPFDFMIDISNAFIDWVNQKNSRALVDELYDSEVIVKKVVANRKFCIPAINSNYNADRFRNVHILYFKGNDIRLKVVSPTGSSESPEIVHVLDKDIAMYICSRILSIINYHYDGNNTMESRDGSSASQTHKTVAYL